MGGYGPARPTLNDLMDAREATEQAGIDPAVSDKEFGRLLAAEHAVFTVWMSGPEAAHLRQSEADG